MTLIITLTSAFQDTENGFSYTVVENGELVNKGWVRATNRSAAETKLARMFCDDFICFSRR